MIEIAANLPAALTPCAGVLPLTEAREAALRQDLIAEARTWITTPYRQLGATKHVAVDCSMLLVCCLVNARIVEPFDPRPYPPAWFIHQDDERYIDWLAMIAVETDEANARAGDFVTFKVGRAFAHSGILSGGGHLIHAFSEDTMVRESPVNMPALATMARGTKPRPRRYFDLFARLRLNGATI